MTSFFRHAFLTLTLALSALAAVPATAQDQPFSEEQKKAIGQIVREYILENPEILPEAIQVLQAREEEYRLIAMKKGIAANQQRLEYDGISPVLGNPDGDVTLVEFYDYQCPFCRRGHSDVLALIDSDPNIRVVYKQFPIKDAPGEEPASLIAARMALAASQQGKFRQFHELAMEAPLPLSEDKLRDVATKAGLNMNLLWSAMSNDSTTKSIRDNMLLAREIGINSTPTYIIGDEVVLGAHGLEALKQAVAVERARSK